MNSIGDDEAPAPPAGFVPQADRGPFTARNGPLFIRRTDEGVEQAFFALRRHCNGLGLVHGGMISAFLDGLLAGAVARETRATPVTMHLSVDFLAMARAGEWLIGEARLSHAARDVGFADGELKVGARPIARASGVFRLMKPRRA